MGIITPELSKRVGWDKPPHITYPTFSLIVGATDWQLLMWYRFLPSPETESQRKIMDFIVRRVQ